MTYDGIRIPKSQEDRTIPILPQIAEILKHQKKTQRNHSLMFGNDYFKSNFIVTYEDGSLIDPRTFSNRFTMILKRASLDAVRFHDLRHTNASLLINDGEDLKTVSEMLGHSTINITADLYSHLYDEKKRNAVNKLGKYIPS